ncbi:hypothetical protein LTR47_001391 [Exophiala xenobiotica]|nr:hypothetical protein LTR92_000043 [Exophiala xenobiotica]KAK5210672.1 hypothetical protein LTR41_003282 [Exophiala xenobiotica]KAK5237127.1 hypothetical protein LTR47_001391 [Exophiala xenobiotica]KAK5381421.1 hypothetical protein LTR11_002904 [Exophiala xenobiotica]KAK5421788.1 hypothetical protein LTR06_000043 [Exophiala xenobiotica]
MSLADFLIDAANNGDDITVVVDEDSEVDPYYTSQTIAASMGSVPGSGKTTFKWQLSWVYAAVSNSTYGSTAHCHVLEVVSELARSPHGGA